MIELAAVIRHLRTELDEARAGAAEEDLVAGQRDVGEQLQWVVRRSRRQPADGRVGLGVERLVQVSHEGHRTGLLHGIPCVIPCNTRYGLSALPARRLPPH